MFVNCPATAGSRQGREKLKIYNSDCINLGEFLHSKLINNNSFSFRLHSSFLAGPVRSLLTEKFEKFFCLE
ncbi:MAG: hypothetical protein COV69_00250 [Parcubacteria group bacterium CG11_big_fil_rev_8_21_14_0_20_39_14]|nr:MAG: hypothetical protein COV69_00250 [Parcubacteria group bacterium CG11_big_fil_rev_8_21_14_0_20_39_14]